MKGSVHTILSYLKSGLLTLVGLTNEKRNALFIKTLSPHALLFCFLLSLETLG